MKILITGASGSIGQEIVKQLIQDNEIICFDRNEEKIFYLEKQLRSEYPNCKLTICLGSITDADRLEQVFAIHKPDVVYHTAANKHVPLGEANIHEFVYNNIQGTITLSKVALSYKCKFVFISTDKAVEPASVMGYTKRMCEKYLLALEDNVVICRFGNIIGSSGSVYEIFERQSKEGFVSVTHPDMERYFISAQDSVKNLIKCSKFDSGLYVFEMGKPVKIMDIAKKFTSNINITGLREGEKIKEKLVYGLEFIEPTSDKDIYKINTLVNRRDEKSILHLANNAINLTKIQILNVFRLINNEL
jgi:FlaA1/EpsC-like NDP-sugar epimerase